MNNINLFETGELREAMIMNRNPTGGQDYAAEEDGFSAEKTVPEFNE